VSLDELPPLEGAPPAVRELLHRLDTEAGVRRLRWIIVALVVLAVAVFIGRGGSRPADPVLVDGSLAPSGRISGFGEAVATLATAAGPRQLCVAVADTPVQRATGLMGRTDLAGYDGMLFRFTGPSQATFYMRNTPLPLGIAWFDAAGRFVSSAQMEPCPDRDGCPTYGATGPYTMALEVPATAFAGLGAGPGSTLTVGGPCS
jgi:uncharacterized membrane protein (UPF0127 family)